MPVLVDTHSNKHTLGDIDFKAVGTHKGRATSTTPHEPQKPNQYQTPYIRAPARALYSQNSRYSLYIRAPARALLCELCRFNHQNSTIT